MLALSITSLLFIRHVTVESTIIVRTRSPTSAVSPPVAYMPIPISRICERSSSVPLIIADMTSPGISILLRPIVLETRMLSTAPTQSKSSVFIINASCAIPFHTLRSPVSFQYMYARADLVPAPSACMILQYSGSPPKMSGIILQNACGKIPLSIFLMALCTSSLAALTPRIIYRLFLSINIFDINSVSFGAFNLCCSKTPNLQMLVTTASQVRF